LFILLHLPLAEVPAYSYEFAKIRNTKNEKKTFIYEDCTTVTDNIVKVI